MVGTRLSCIKPDTQMYITPDQHEAEDESTNSVKSDESLAF